MIYHSALGIFTFVSSGKVNEKQLGLEIFEADKKKNAG